MEITSTGRGHELLFHRGGCATAHYTRSGSENQASARCVGGV